MSGKSDNKSSNRTACCCFSNSLNEEPLLNEKELGKSENQANKIVETLLLQPPKASKMHYEPPQLIDSSVSRLSLPFAPAQKEAISFSTINSSFIHVVKCGFLKKQGVKSLLKIQLQFIFILLLQ